MLRFKTLLFVAILVLSACAAVDSQDQYNLYMRSPDGVARLTVYSDRTSIMLPFISVDRGTLTINSTGDQYVITQLMCVTANHTFDLLAWGYAQRVDMGQQVCFNSTGLVNKDQAGGKP